MRIVVIPHGAAATAALRSAVTRLLAELDPDAEPANLDGLLADPAARLLVAVSDETYVGMLSLSFRSSLTRTIAYIDHVVVDPGWRRQGIASALVREALAVATSAGASRVDLTSSADRTEAQALYASLGFEQRQTVNWRRTV